MLPNALNTFRPGFDKHEFQCPHCRAQTLYFLPGSMVLFSTATCQHCNREFLIVQNRPQNKRKPVRNTCGLPVFDLD